MSYNRYDFRERPSAGNSNIIITVSISVTVTLAVVLSLMFIFRLSIFPPPPVTPPGPGTTQIPATSPQPGNCNERKETGVGNTATYSFTVPDGCVAVVTGVNVTGVPNSWSDGGGGIEGLQPGSYTVTILDGSYQIGTTAAGQAMWCNIYTWEQQNGKADTYNYPIDGWSSNCS